MENNKIQEIYDRLITEQAFAEELKKFEDSKEITTPEESAAAFIEFAKLHGYDVTIDELKAFAENQSKALSEEDLDSVNAAGIATWIAKAIVTNKPTGVCLGVGLGWGLAEGVGVTDCKIIGQGSGYGWKEGDHEAHEKRIERIFRAHNAAGLLLPKN